LIETGPQREETIKGITEAITSVDNKIPTATKEITHKTTSKGTPLPPETHPTLASNAEKRGITRGTAQNVAQIINTIGQLT